MSITDLFILSAEKWVTFPGSHSTSSENECKKFCLISVFSLHQQMFSCFVLQGTGNILICSKSSDTTVNDSHDDLVSIFIIYTWNDQGYNTVHWHSSWLLPYL